MAIKPKPFSLQGIPFSGTLRPDLVKPGATGSKTDVEGRRSPFLDEVFVGDGDVTMKAGGDDEVLTGGGGEDVLTADSYPDVYVGGRDGQTAEVPGDIEPPVQRLFAAIFGDGRFSLDTAEKVAGDGVDVLSLALGIISGPATGGASLLSTAGRIALSSGSKNVANGLLAFRDGGETVGRTDGGTKAVTAKPGELVLSLPTVKVREDDARIIFEMPEGIGIGDRQPGLPWKNISLPAIESVFIAYLKHFGIKPGDFNTRSFSGNDRERRFLLIWQGDVSHTISMEGLAWLLGAQIGRKRGDGPDAEGKGATTAIVEHIRAAARNYFSRNPADSIGGFSGLPEIKRENKKISVIFPEGTTLSGDGQALSQRTLELFFAAFIKEFYDGRADAFSLEQFRKLRGMVTFYAGGKEVAMVPRTSAVASLYAKITGLPSGNRLSNRIKKRAKEDLSTGPVAKEKTPTGRTGTAGATQATPTADEQKGVAGGLSTAISTLQELAARASEMEAEISKLTAEIGKLKEELSEAEKRPTQGELEAKIGEIAEKEAELRKANARISDLEGRLQAAKSELAELRGEYKELLASTATWQKRAEAAEKKNVELNKALTAAREKMSQIERLENESARLASDLSALRKSTGLATDELNRVLADVIRLKDSLATLFGPQTPAVELVAKVEAGIRRGIEIFLSEQKPEGRAAPPPKAEFAGPAVEVRGEPAEKPVEAPPAGVVRKTPPAGVAKKAHVPEKKATPPKKDDKAADLLNRYPGAHFINDLSKEAVSVLYYISRRNSKLGGSLIRAVRDLEADYEGISELLLSSLAVIDSVKGLRPRDAVDRLAMKITGMRRTSANKSGVMGLLHEVIRTAGLIKAGAEITQLWWPTRDISYYGWRLALGGADDLKLVKADAKVVEHVDISARGADGLIYEFMMLDGFHQASIGYMVGMSNAVWDIRVNQKGHWDAERALTFYRRLLQLGAAVQQGEVNGVELHITSEEELHPALVEVIQKTVPNVKIVRYRKLDTPQSAAEVIKESDGFKWVLLPDAEAEAAGGRYKLVGETTTIFQPGRGKAGATPGWQSPIGAKTMELLEAYPEYDFFLARLSGWALDVFHQIHTKIGREKGKGLLKKLSTYDERVANRLLPAIKVLTDKAADAENIADLLLSSEDSGDLYGVIHELIRVADLMESGVEFIAVRKKIKERVLYHGWSTAWEGLLSKSNRAFMDQIEVDALDANGVLYEFKSISSARGQPVFDLLGEMAAAKAVTIGTTPYDKRTIDAAKAVYNQVVKIGEAVQAGVISGAELHFTYADPLPPEFVEFVQARIPNVKIFRYGSLDTTVDKAEAIPPSRKFHWAAVQGQPARYLRVDGEAKVEAAPAEGVKIHAPAVEDIPPDGMGAVEPIEVPIDIQTADAFYDILSRTGAVLYLPDLFDVEKPVPMAVSSAVRRLHENMAERLQSIGDSLAGLKRVAKRLRPYLGGMGKGLNFISSIPETLSGRADYLKMVVTLSKAIEQMERLSAAWAGAEKAFSEASLKAAPAKDKDEPDTVGIIIPPITSDVREALSAVQSGGLDMPEAIDRLASALESFAKEAHLYYYDRGGDHAAVSFEALFLDAKDVKDTARPISDADRDLYRQMIEEYESDARGAGDGSAALPLDSYNTIISVLRADLSHLKDGLKGLTQQDEEKWFAELNQVTSKLVRLWEMNAKLAEIGGYLGGQGVDEGVKGEVDALYADLSALSNDDSLETAVKGLLSRADRILEVLKIGEKLKEIGDITARLQPTSQQKDDIELAGEEFRALKSAIRGGVSDADFSGRAESALGLAGDLISALRKALEAEADKKGNPRDEVAGYATIVLTPILLPELENRPDRVRLVAEAFVDSLEPDDIAHFARQVSGGDTETEAFALFRGDITRLYDKWSAGHAEFLAGLAVDSNGSGKEAGWESATVADAREVVQKLLKAVAGSKGFADWGVNNTPEVRRFHVRDILMNVRGELGDMLKTADKKDDDRRNFIQGLINEINSFIPLFMGKTHNKPFILGKYGEQLIDIVRKFLWLGGK